jgi:hypothetical protein
MKRWITAVSYPRLGHQKCKNYRWAILPKQTQPAQMPQHGRPAVHSNGDINWARAHPRHSRTAKSRLPSDSAAVMRNLGDFVASASKIWIVQVTAPIGSLSSPSPSATRKMPRCQLPPAGANIADLGSAYRQFFERSQTHQSVHYA